MPLAPSNSYILSGRVLYGRERVLIQSELTQLACECWRMPPTHLPLQPRHPVARSHLLDQSLSWLSESLWGNKIKNGWKRTFLFDSEEWERWGQRGGQEETEFTTPPPVVSVSWNKKSPIKSVWVRVICVCVSEMCIQTMSACVCNKGYRGATYCKLWSCLRKAE